MDSKNPIEAIQEIARTVGGRIEEVGLFDDHGFATMSFDLPPDHWLYQENPEPPPAPFLMGTDNPLREPLARAIRQAGIYAIRATTTSGTIDDYDPDAWLQNLVVAMLGYWTPDGRSHLEEF